MQAFPCFVSGAAVALLVIAAVSIAGCMSPSQPTASVPIVSPLITVSPTIETTPIPVATTMIMAESTPSSPVTTIVSTSQNVSVSIQNYAFIPASVTIRPGTTITWTNLDPIYHTATSTEPSPVAFNSPVLHQGDTFQFTFAQPGTYHYLCNIHPFMRGIVTVSS
ncbi:MAG: plastocyanin/azurin family copper-binding protein [Methanoregula sp.]|uniref:cupredoxin domain-containing protein n=1 Tax=Methanoregula sp. TaxID=2052170 RepID=UPI003BAEE4F7